MRITIKNEDFGNLLKILRKHDEYQMHEILSNSRDVYYKSITIKKINATKNATKTKIDESIRKVENAINLLRMEGKKINANTISKMANIDYKTASKYYKKLGISL